MTRTDYIKKQSYTQQKAERYMANITKVCQITGMSRDEWSEYFFEFGCHLAETCYADALHFLTDHREGYWNSLLMIYLKDDEAALQDPELNIKRYFNFKDLLMSRLSVRVNIPEPVAQYRKDRGNTSGQVLVS